MSFHLMTVLEISHFNKNGNILFKKNNLKNVLHSQGEEYMLRALFGGIPVVSSYYIGLDNRNTILTSDTHSLVSSLETSGVGYFRQQVSNTSFQIENNSQGNKQANSPIVQFRCTSNSWSAKNIFLTTSLGSVGMLISSVPLGTTLTVSEDEIVSMRIGLSLKNSSN
jgi:hypothetical protein